MSNVVLLPKSKIGQQCTKLFLDWMEGKISKAEFNYEVKLIEKLIMDKQLILKFEKNNTCY